MYGALVAAPDSIRTGLLKAFAPRTSPPSVATVLRSILWPLAILLVIHRSYVLATNGYITDDYGPVYRAVVNLKHGWDIYNEHLDYVDPHYLYPPGGTLLMAPFGYLPVDASRYWFITINTVAIVIAAYLLVRLFNYTISSVAFPALLVAMFCTESVINTLVFANINGCVLLAEVLFLRWLLDGNRSHEWWAGIAVGLSLVVKPVLAPLLLLPLLNRQWRSLVTAVAVPVVFNLAAIFSPVARFRVSGSDELHHPHAAVYLLDPRLLQQLDPRQRDLLRPANMADLAAAHRLCGSGRRECVAAVQVLPEARPAVLDGDNFGCSADRLVVGAVAGPGLLLDDVVPVLDDGGSAEFGDPQLACVASDLRLHERRPLAPRALADDGPRLEYLRVTYGWSLMLIVVFCVLYFRYLDAKADGRLDQGIDPQWMKQTSRPPQPAPA